jgi:hypothetical protein
MKPSITGYVAGVTTNPSAPLAFALLVALAGCGVQLPDPSPEAVVPSHGWTGDDTHVAITGNHFYPQVEVDAAGRDNADVDTTFRVDLVDGDVVRAIGGVTLRDYHLIDASVPAGIPPGTYDLVVTGPTGRVGTLPDAFEVTESRADHLAVDVDGSVSYVVGERATVTVQLEAPPPDDEPVLDDIEVTVTATADDGVLVPVFAASSLLDQEPTADGLGIHGRLRSDGSARVGITVGTPDTVKIEVSPDNTRSGIAGGSIKLAWSPGAATALVIDLPSDGFVAQAGQAFTANVTVVDQYGNPIDAAENVILKDTCTGTTSAPVVVRGSAAISMVLQRATGSEACPTDALTTLIGPAGTSAPFDVRSGPIDQFEVLISREEVTAGDLLFAFVTPVDAFGNRAAWPGHALVVTDSVDGIADGAHACSTDSSIFCQLTPTVAGEGVVLEVAGDDGTTGTSEPYTVRPAAPVGIAVTVRGAPIAAGDAASVTVSVLDRFGNVVDASAYAATAFAFADGQGPVACSETGINGGVAAFDCMLTHAGGAVILEASLTDLGLVASSLPFQVTNGPVASVLITPATQTVTAGQSASIGFAAFDAFGNPYTVRADPVLDVADSSGTLSLTTVTIGSGGTVTRTGTLTEAGDTRITASQGGVVLGTSDVVTVLPAGADHLEVTPRFPWAWVGEPADVDVRAVDAFGNTTDTTATAALTTATGNAPDATSALVAGAGSATVTWTDPSLSDRIDATAGALSGSSGRVVVVTDCAPGGPVAQLSFGGLAEAVACADPLDGTAAIATSLAGSTGLPVLYAAAVDDAPPILGTTPDLVATAPGIGVFPVRALVADAAACGSESASVAWVGADDGQPTGPLDVRLGVSTLAIGGATVISVVGATDCAGDPAGGASVLLATDRGDVTGAAPTGEGLSIKLDPQGDGLAGLDLASATTGGAGRVHAAVFSGAALGDAEFLATGDDARPIVWSQSPSGDTAGLVDTVILGFSEPMLDASVVVSSFAITGPDPASIATATLSSDGRTVTLGLTAPIDAGAGTWSVTGVSTPTSGLRDEAGNRLDGTWTGAPTSYVGTFGDLPAAIGPVLSCSTDQDAFRPDGDDGAGPEADAVQFAFDAAATPVWWVVSVEDAAGAVIRRTWFPGTAPAGSFAWDGRDQGGRIVAAGGYTLRVDADDGFGNRGGDCATAARVVSR